MRTEEMTVARFLWWRWSTAASLTVWTAHKSSHAVSEITEDDPHAAMVVGWSCPNGLGLRCAARSLTSGTLKAFVLSHWST
uniref:Putative secreted peptide n=1 Tax=Anopheles braziliensis TaxID=58242 RepID=A0A2M3ZT34_9DIPT